MPRGSYRFSLITCWSQAAWGHYGSPRQRENNCDTTNAGLWEKEKDIWYCHEEFVIEQLRSMTVLYGIFNYLPHGRTGLRSNS